MKENAVVPVPSIAIGILAAAVIVLPPVVTARPAFAAESPPCPPADLRVGGVMQVVAHEDDDLLFMNPDISRSIRAGLPSVTVYLTAGEISGNGDTSEHRARNRQRGAQNAYAFMAGVADGDDATQDEWAGELSRIGERPVERYRLRERPGVHLLFVNLPDFALSDIDSGGEQRSVVPAAGLVTEPSTYVRADVVALLTAILDLYRPVLLRSQDPEPSWITDPMFGFTRPSDHPDHVIGARFAREAAAARQEPLYEVSYRDYDTSSLPVNLSDADAAGKSRIVDQYYRYDQAYKDSHKGDQWLPRQYYRWSRGTNWATRDATGRLEVFEVRGGGVWRYQQTGGGRWNGPTRLADPGGALVPGLAIGRDADGRLEIFAHRLADHHLVSLRQDAPGGSFGTAWADLGSPSLGSDLADQVGTPAVALGRDDRLRVFVRNADGGVSVLTQPTPGGSWSGDGWTALLGTDVQDGLSAVTVPGGSIELYASSKIEILRWRQDQVTGAFDLTPPIPTGVPASPPRAIVDPAGRVYVSYLDSETASVRLTHQIEPNGDTWLAEPVSFEATGGTGDPAMTVSSADRNARVVLLARNRDLGVSASVQRGGDSTFGPWDDLGGITLDQPAAATDADGHAMIFAIGRHGVSAGRIDVSGTTSSVSGWGRLAG